MACARFICLARWTGRVRGIRVRILIWLLKDLPLKDTSARSQSCGLYCLREWNSTWSRWKTRHELAARMKGDVKMPEDPKAPLILEIDGELANLMRVVGEASLAEGAWRAAVCRNHCRRQAVA